MGLDLHPPPGSMYQDNNNRDTMGDGGGAGDFGNADNLHGAGDHHGANDLRGADDLGGGGDQGSNDELEQESDDELLPDLDRGIII